MDRCRCLVGCVGVGLALALALGGIGLGLGLGALLVQHKLGVLRLPPVVLLLLRLLLLLWLAVGHLKPALGLTGNKACAGGGHSTKATARVRGAQAYPDREMDRAPKSRGVAPRRRRKKKTSASPFRSGDLRVTPTKSYEPCELTNYSIALLFAELSAECVAKFG